MNVDPAHFSSVERFFGSDWLLRESQKYQRELAEAAIQGFIDDRPNYRTHPVVQYWSKKVIGVAADPSDWIVTGSARLDNVARTLHRMLYLEAMLNELTPTWGPNELQEVRNRMINLDQYPATLYELFVLANLRRGNGNDFRFVREVGSPAPVPDIVGKINDTVVNIECKRLSPHSEFQQARRKIWQEEAQALANRLRVRGQSGIVIVEHFNEPTSNDIDNILEKFEAILDAGESYAQDSEGRFGVHFNSEAITDASEITGLSLNVNDFDHVHVEGSTTILEKVELSDVEIDELVAIAIVHHPPTDRSAGVLNILRQSLKKFSHEHCNIVCLEIADLPNFQYIEEYQLVFEAIKRFLARDTKRVSAVVLTLYGVIPPSEGLGVYETYAQSWIFPNQRASVPIPEGFDISQFAWPKVQVRLSSME